MNKEEPAIFITQPEIIEHIELEDKKGTKAISITTYNFDKSHLFYYGKDLGTFEELSNLRHKLAASEQKRLNAIEILNNFDVFKRFSFPLMKKWKENQVKSSIDYEFKQSLYKELLEILEEEK